MGRSKDRDIATSHTRTTKQLPNEKKKKETTTSLRCQTTKEHTTLKSNLWKRTHPYHPTADEPSRTTPPPTHMATTSQHNKAREETPATTPLHRSEENMEQDIIVNVIGKSDQSSQVETYRTATETRRRIATSGKKKNRQQAQNDMSAREFTTNYLSLTRRKKHT